MAVAFRSASSGTDLTTALPSGHAQDDILLAQVSCENNGVAPPTAATGWTQIDGYNTDAEAARPLAAYWFWIARGAGTPATNWSWGQPSEQVSYLCYSGAHLTAPVVDYAKNTTAGGGDNIWECLTFTNNVDQSMEIAMGALNQWQTSTSTMTNERVDGGATLAAHFYDHGLIGTGSVSQKTITSGAGWHVIHLALRPAAGAAAGDVTPAARSLGHPSQGFQFALRSGVDPSGISASPAATSATATGQAYGAVATVAATSNSSAATGAANAATAKVAPVAAAAATATGAASDTTAKVASTASTATATGSAQPAQTSIAPHAGVATATGAAYDATATTGTIAPATIATATGAAYDVHANIAATAQTATATGAALASTAKIASSAATATATGASGAVTAKISPNAGVATATGQAYNATATTGSATNAPAGVASATGAATSPTVKTAPNAGTATATASAGNASASIAVTAALAAATAVALIIAARIAPTAGTATATGGAGEASATVPDIGPYAPADNRVLRVIRTSYIVADPNRPSRTLAVRRPSYVVVVLVDRPSQTD